MLFLAGAAAAGGFDDLADDARHAVEGALPGMLERARTRCDDDQAAGERDLVTIVAYAGHVGLLEVESAAALEACRIAVHVSPTLVTLEPGAQQQFTHTVSGVSNATGNDDVTWTAPDGGTITAAGLFTAPQQDGTYHVRATSALNPQRFGEATVTVETGGACNAAPPPARRTAAMARAADVTIDEPSDIAALAGVTAITGNLIIRDNLTDGVTLTDLDGLQQLTTVSGSLFVSDNPGLTNLQGLSGVTSVGGLFVVRNAVLHGLGGLQALRSDPGALIVDGNPQLTQIDALSGVAGAVGSLRIDNNAQLTQVDGLCGITAAHDVSLSNSPALTSITGLSALTEASAGLRVFNTGLQTLHGLEAVTTAGLLELSGPHLASIAELSSLRTIRDFTIFNDPSNTALVTARLPALEEAAGRVRVSGAGGVLRAVAFPALRRITNTDAAPSLVLGDAAGTFSAPQLQSTTRDVRVSATGADLAVDLGTATIGGNLDVTDNVASTSLAVTTGAVTGSLRVSSNRDLDLSLATGAIGDSVLLDCNTGIGLGDLSFGAVTFDLRVDSNVGFTDDEARTWAFDHQVGRFRTIIGNVAGGASPCGP